MNSRQLQQLILDQMKKGATKEEIEKAASARVTPFDVEQIRRAMEKRKRKQERNLNLKGDQQ